MTKTNRNYNNIEHMVLKINIMNIDGVLAQIEICFNSRASLWSM